jgi:hypothetical protein
MTTPLMNSITTSSISTSNTSPSSHSQLRGVVAQFRIRLKPKSPLTSHPQPQRSKLKTSSLILEKGQLSAAQQPHVSPQYVSLLANPYHNSLCRQQLTVIQAFALHATAVIAVSNSKRHVTRQALCHITASKEYGYASLPHLGYLGTEGEDEDTVRTGSREICCPVVPM